MILREPTSFQRNWLFCSPLDQKWGLKKECTLHNDLSGVNNIIKLLLLLTWSFRLKAGATTITLEVDTKTCTWG